MVAHARAPREPLGGDQGAHRDHDGDQHQPSRGGVAVRRLDQRLDRRGNGLGLAGNIGHKSNGGAELADRLGKAQHHPGQASGNVTVANTRQGAAPSVLAACSSRRSIASIDSRIGRTKSGNDITPQASAAPVQRKAKTMPR